MMVVAIVLWVRQPTSNNLLSIFPFIGGLVVLWTDNSSRKLNLILTVGVLVMGLFLVAWIVFPLNSLPFPPFSRASTSPSPTTIAYKTNWASGLSGWPKVQSWYWNDGELNNDGINESPIWVAAPVSLGSNSDYTIEAKIEGAALVHGRDCSTHPAGFGIVSRGSSISGYWAGIVIHGSHQNVCDMPNAEITVVNDGNIKRLVVKASLPANLRNSLIGAYIFTD